MRSGPTSRGLSTASAIGTLTPGSTLKGAWPKYSSHMRSSVCWTGGTTFESAMPRMSLAWMPRVRSRVSKKIPYSSAVCSRRLVSRQETRSRGPSKTPIFVFVLPTSATSSMRHPALGDLPGHHAPHGGAVVHEKGAVGVEANRRALEAVDRHAAADGVGEREPPRAHRADALPLEPRAPDIERLEERGEEGVPLDGAPGLDAHRRRPGVERRREARLVQVDADADHEERRRRQARLDENARQLPAADEDVVRPLEPGRQAGRRGQRLGDRDGARQRYGRQPRQRQTRADHDGREQAPPRRGGP